MSMSTQKMNREMAKGLNPLGWELIGKDGSDHFVWEGPEGLLMHTSATPSSPTNEIANALTKAKRAKQRQDGSVNYAFTEWLLARYGIGKRDSKDVEFELADMIGVFEKETGLHQLRGGYTRLGYIDHRVVRLNGKKGQATTQWRLSGAHALQPLDGNGGSPHYPAEDETGSEVCEAKLPLKGGGLAVCTRPLGHEGEHIDKMRKTHWTVRPDEGTKRDPTVAARVVVTPVVEPKPVLRDDLPVQPMVLTREQKIAALIQELAGPEDDTKVTMARDELRDMAEKLNETAGSISIAFDQLKTLQDNVNTLLDVLDAEA